MIRERVLLDDGGLALVDVRCLGAPAADGPMEAASATEVVIPLDGLFVRTVRRPRRGTRAAESIGDPGRALIFQRGVSYRVAHPAGGRDRSLVIALREPQPWFTNSSPSDRPVPPAISLAARRLAAALSGEHPDALAGAEVALAVLDAVLGSRVPAAARASDVAVARRVRVEIAATLGERASLSALGRRVGLSGWELARRFRRATGTSIHRYRTGLRVQAALERIEAGERDLTGLALDLGFSDHSHLTNVLRREAGRPPSAFRRPPTPAELGALRTILQA